uniref:Retrotransposon Copia-like N-terminal domain-containing protein n=1 Tax=Cajanus cajan TaxID=3821 RepID=A0A151RKQ6_CAJCA|nr:hypothetical protein KK1_035415 [Cajanus cajan]
MATNKHFVAPTGIKLDGTNYALWNISYTFRRLRTKIAIVKGWLINSMDQYLVSNFIYFSTTKHV